MTIELSSQASNSWTVTEKHLSVVAHSVSRTRLDFTRKVAL
jgi:hypothetical protein